MPDSVVYRGKHWEARVEMAIYAIPELSIYDKQVYSVLRGFSDKAGAAFPTSKTVATYCSCSPRQVNRAMQNLENCGLIRRTPKFSNDGARTSNLYEIFDADAYQKTDAPATVSQGAATVSRNPTTVSQGDYDCQSQLLNSINSSSLTAPYNTPKPPECDEEPEQKNEPEDPDPSQGKEPVHEEAAAVDSQQSAVEKQQVNPLDEWFDKFWDNYPRHEDKKRAYKTFMALFHRQTYQRQRDRMNNLILRLTRYIYDCKGKEPQYIKLPSTWLNAHNFDEEPEENEILRSEKWVPHAGHNTD